MLSFEGSAAFAPKEILTRAEASALIYRLMSGDVEDKDLDLYDYSTFGVVAEGAWYTGYVTYAATKRAVVGYGDGNFHPEDEVTGVQVLKIMLRAIGYGQNSEYEGAGWKDNVLTTATDLGLLAGIEIDTIDYTNGKAGITLNDTAYYVATRDGYVSLAFVYNYGVNTIDSFYIYDVDPYNTTATAKGDLYYTYKAVREVDIASGLTVTLNATQNTYVLAHGVGYYAIAKNGGISYTSFVELMSNLSWANEAIVNSSNRYGVKAGANIWNENTTFTVFDVVKKTATNFTMTAGYNEFFNFTSDTQGFVVSNNGVAKNVYIVVGPVATAAQDPTPTVEVAANGVVTQYYVAEKYVTGVERSDAVTYTVTIDGAVWKEVVKDTVVTLPNKTDAMVGTGMKVIEGSKVSYVPYGGKLTVTADTVIETGYVNFKVDGVDNAVKYSNDKEDKVLVKNLALKNAGTYVYSDWGTDAAYGAVATQTHQPNCGHIITSGFYKVTVTGTGTVTVNGEVETAITFYVTAADTVIAAKTSGEQVGKWGLTDAQPIAADIPIVFPEK